MVSGDIWGLIGLIGAIIGIAVSVYLNKRSSVVVYVQRWTKIVDDITKSIDGLEVSYRGIRDLRNLVRITGFVQNAGSVDVSAGDVHVPLAITLPGESKWLQVTISGEEAGATATVLANRLEMTWALFRPKERIQFDALIEFLPTNASGMRVSDVLASSGRIKNTRVRTLRDLNVSLRPILDLGMAASLFWFVFLLWAFVLQVNNGANLNIYSEGREVQPYVSADDRLCVSEHYSPWQRIVPFLSTPACVEVVTTTTAKMGKLEIRMEKLEPPPIWQRILLGLLTLYYGLIVARDIYQRYATQRRHFGRVVWVGMRNRNGG